MSDARDPDTSDDTLIAAARSGDVRAFETLLDRHQSRVLRVLRLLGVPAQDREDVAQEVFIRVFRHLDGFRRGRPFPAWLYRVAVNACHDYRQRGRRVSGGEEAWGTGLDDAPDSRPGPGQLAHGRDLRRALEDALESLSERERAVFVLRELEGLETRDIARALGVTSITVRRHLGLAKGRLRNRLEEIEKKTEFD